MPTCKTWLAAALLALPGCSDLLATRSAPAMKQIALPDGMIVAGANGWCVDPQSSRARGETAVVVLGSCAAIGRNALAPRPDVPGVVTVSVEGEAGGSVSVDDLKDFFMSDAGRATLARDGQAGSVDILDADAREDRLMLVTADKSALPGAARDVWRALFDLGGRFVSVSLYGLPDAQIDPQAGLDAVDAQVDQILDANRPNI